MGYCTYITRDGYELQAKLFAEGGNFNITKVEVGAGVCPADVDPSTLTALVEFKATATSTKPHRAGCEVSLTVEYRSDLDGGLKKPFQINEFGVFATGVDGDEILLLYGDLSDYPESAVPQEYGGCVRRYPINVTIGPEANATLSYPAGAWMTHEEAEDLINAALNKGLDMGDGTTVPEAVENIKNELDQTKEDLKNDLDSAKADMQDDLNSLKQAVDGSSWYRAFEPEEWTGNQIRFSKEEHGMAPKQSACVFNLRSRSGRTAREYDDAHISTVAADLIEMVAQALAANTATPGTYPTAEDGHVLLTWEQVQYFLLEDILASSSVASSKAAELGFGSWKDRDIGVEPTVTLDEMLSSAYLPALGGPATAFNAMCTAQMLQGLHFRRAVAGEGYAAKYDLDGYLTPTWGTVGSRVYWDMATSDLVLDSAGPFSGDILVMGPADVKIGSSGGSSGSSMARSVDWDDIQNKPDVALRSNVFPTEHLYFQGVVPDMESLPAMNLGEDVGKMWAVTSINRYYVWTGNGWVTAPYRAIFEHTKEDIDLLLKPDKENSQDTGE